jgi:hypothetical protein
MSKLVKGKQIEWIPGTIILGAKSIDIASNTVTDLSTATGNYVHITGANTIEDFGDVLAGTQLVLVFDNSLTLTYNVTSLILPTATDIVTQTGDSIVIESEGGGNWRCITYNKKDGTPLKGTDNFYYLDFTSAISFTILGTAYNFGRVPNIKIYDTTGQEILANTNINYTTFDVSVIFKKTQSGKIILT